MAPAVIIALLACVLGHWLVRGRLPWPRPSALLAVSAALLAWGAASAAWAPHALHALQGVASLGGLLLLAAMAARAVAEDEARNLRLLPPALAIGLGLGILAAGLDHASGNMLRAAVRGFPPITPQLGFGLKAAVTVIVVLLPLVLGLRAVPGRLRLGLLAAGTALALALPAESAKIAVVVALGVGAAAAVLPRLSAGLAIAAALAVVLAAPLATSQILARSPDIARLPPSATHRVLIWDFVAARIADRPLGGWGFESSRRIPGGDDVFPADTTARFGLTTPALQDYYRGAKQLPLHPHNAALQLWLELGAVGAALGAALAALLLRAALRTGLPAAGLGAAAACAVVGLLSYGMWQPWWIATQALVAVTLVGLGRLHRPAG